MVSDTRVLVADATFGDRLLIELEVESRLGLRLVAKARTGTEAAELCEQLKPDVIVFDPHIPVADGRGLVTLVRELSSQAKVIFWSDSDDRRLHDLAASNGADACVAKHRNVRELISQIERMR